MTSSPPAVDMTSWRRLRPEDPRKYVCAAETFEQWARQYVRSGRAAGMYATLGHHCRAIAAAIKSDPTLATEPSDTGWTRPLCLFEELLLQLEILIPRAVDKAAAGHSGTWWDDADAVYTRAIELGKQIPEIVPRAGHDSVHGVQAISENRIAARRDSIVRAAALVRLAVQSAAAVQHPCPRVDELLALAGELERHSIELEGSTSSTFRTPRT